MVFGIILVVLIVIGVLMMMRDSYDIFGFLIGFIFGIALIIHTIVTSTRSYQYDIFIQEKESFEETLKFSREFGNEYESATILKEVIEINATIKLNKWHNKNWFLGQYVDDRIEDLQPIK